MKKEYISNTEFFEDVEHYQKKLLECGHNHAAKEIQEGLGCINCLTDGWALFMESLEKVFAEYAAELSEEQKEMLNNFIAVTKKAVYRE
jgi:hypothetical protein